MSVVFLDTQIVIWAILGQANEKQKVFIPKAKYLISELEKQKVDLYISSVSLAEMLCGVPKEKHDTIRQEIQKFIKVASFDSLAAKYYGKIWRENKNTELYEELKRMGFIRREFQADCTILATALAKNAEILYTYDKPFKKIAKQYLKIPDMLPLPDIPCPLPFS